MFAEDTLFATLDPTIRAVSLPGGSKAVLSDTVGFISDLPTTLIAAFRATLEEVLEAELILHVRDIADETSGSQRADVNAVLGELGVDAEGEPDRLLEVWNKADLLDEAASRRARQRGAPRRRRPGLGGDRLRTRRVARRDRAAAQSPARDASRSRSSPRRARCRTGSTRIAKWSRARIWARGSPRLRIRVAPEKRERLARLAGPARFNARRGIAIQALRLGGLGLVPERDPSLRASHPRGLRPSLASAVSMLSKRRTNLALASRSAASGSTPRCRAIFAMTNSRSPNSSATRLRVTLSAFIVGDRRLQLGDFLLGLGEHRREARPVEPDLARRASAA